MIINWIYLCIFFNIESDQYINNRWYLFILNLIKNETDEINKTNMLNKYVKQIC
jgi:hypothetical protein